MYLGALAFTAAALAVPGSLLWDVFVWIVAMLFAVLLAAAFVLLAFPRSLRRWLAAPDNQTGRK